MSGELPPGFDDDNETGAPPGFEDVESEVAPPGFEEEEQQDQQTTDSKSPEKQQQQVPDLSEGQAVNNNQPQKRERLLVDSDSPGRANSDSPLVKKQKVDNDNESQSTKSININQKGKKGQNQQQKGPKGKGKSQSDKTKGAKRNSKSHSDTAHDAELGLSPSAGETRKNHDAASMGNDLTGEPALPSYLQGAQFLSFDSDAATIMSAGSSVTDENQNQNQTQNQNQIGATETVEYTQIVKMRIGGEGQDGGVEGLDKFESGEDTEITFGLEDDPNDVPHFIQQQQQQQQQQNNNVWIDQDGKGTLFGYSISIDSDSGNPSPPIYLYNTETDLYYRVSDKQFYKKKIQNNESESQNKGLVLYQSEETEGEFSRKVGTCSQWMEKKGFGFITLRNGMELFVHHKQLSIPQRSEFRRLFEGEIVSFTVKESPDDGRRLYADDVQLVKLSDIPNTNSGTENTGGEKQNQNPGANGTELGGDEDSESGEELNVFKSLNCSYGTAQGSQKDENQDRIAEKRLLANFNEQSEAEVVYFALFDGHNGSRCAEFAKTHLHTNLCASMNNISLGGLQNNNNSNKNSDKNQQNNSQNFVSQIKKAHKAAYKNLDHNWLSLAKRQRDFSGSTSVTALFYGPDDNGELSLFTSHAGDSFAILCRGGTAKRLTKDHKPNTPTELQRIRALPNSCVQNCSGCWRVLVRTNGVNYMGLAVSRSFGDLPFKESGIDYITSTPDINHICIDREHDEFLILCSDGISDAFTDDELITFCRAHILEENLPDLVIKEAKRRESGDDCSVAICKFDWNSEIDSRDGNGDRDVDMVDAVTNNVVVSNGSVPELDVEIEIPQSNNKVAELGNTSVGNGSVKTSTDSNHVNITNTTTAVNTNTNSDSESDIQIAIKNTSSLDKSPMISAADAANSIPTNDTGPGEAATDWLKGDVINDDEDDDDEELGPDLERVINVGGGGGE